MSGTSLPLAAAAIAAVISAPALAQQQQQQTQPQPNVSWDNLPRMSLERQFAGPLRDTIIQRWRDPADGTVCYIYLPITAQHTQPTQGGFVSYGSNSIGSISCYRPHEVAPAQPRPPAKK